MQRWPDAKKAETVQNLHEAHVRNAVQNWNNMAKVALTGFVIVAKIVGAQVPPDVENLIDKLGLST